ncbi:nuclear transport factor 2 family protein [Flavobacterium sp. ZT3R18]|uniref:nuclear transport factor 2 family protein n=1 Tax=Flavobacterium sp. ZT3R18 TaxID=2594429 RepID=UPI00117A981E|nr:nuclear transport factor 2 family protein [Flavobacterium sp. ZT3R18]TRX34000.1 nuclear transport factor 2 family protein [Flavobacterium sp. ZT3R18]
MKTFFLSLALLAVVSFDSLQYKESDEKQQVNATLDAWHKAAAEANYNAYFGMMTEDAIFIGTDPTENWDLKAFQAFAKPYFDKGKAWDFKAMERHVYFDKSGKLAWFDELLNTQMKICRGSGVLVKIDKEWKIKHYVLSMTIPNDNTNEVIKIIAPIEDALIQKGRSK